jgi:hypothetical protein
MRCGCFEHGLRKLNLRDNCREHFGLIRQRLGKLLSTSSQSGEFGFQTASYDPSIVLRSVGIGSR